MQGTIIHHGHTAWYFIYTFLTDADTKTLLDFLSQRKLSRLASLVIFLIDRKG
jgi:hypothetical protein